MPNQIRKLLILTSGGDAPGMNAAIRAVVRSALHYGMEVFGTEKGYCGLIEQAIFPLGADSVANIIQHGGTILKTGRSDEFKKKTIRDKCRNFLAKEGIDAIVVLGGNGSFLGATLLEQEGGPKVIGIPCTIDNDILGTDYCIGFDTACNTAIKAVDKIRDTAFSIGRNFLIEVMGRSSGFIAAEVGVATGAEIILTPEFPISTEELVLKIKNKQRKKLVSLIIAAEADQPERGFVLAREIKKLSGIDYKVSILGYIQRGGAPSVKDRSTASVMGVMAIEALHKGQAIRENATSR